MAAASIRSEFLPTDVLPVVFGLVLTALLFRYWVPFALRRVQIAFYTDDGIYEVHRITDTVEGSRKLMREDGALLGVSLYRMAVTGLMVLAGEVLFQPEEYSLLVLLLIMVLLGIPVLISPVSSLIGQFTKRLTTRKADLIEMKKQVRILTVVLSFTLVLLALGFWFYLNRVIGMNPEKTRAWTLIIFLLPSVVVYGRVMGSSWNGLVQQKWRRAAGQASALNPYPPNFAARMFALFILVNTILMPITALNGAISYGLQVGAPADWFIHSEFALSMYPEAEGMTLSRQGGFLGFWSIELFSRIPDAFVASFLTELTVLFLILNVTVMGLAFVYEMVRMQFLGLAQIGGFGGVHLADGRALRSEAAHRGRLVSFCFSAFTGYTILMLVVAIFGRFPGVLPDSAMCTEQLGTLVGSASVNIRGTTMQAETCGVLSPSVVEQLTYAMNATGQALFIPFWFLSLPLWFKMRNAKFDLSAIEDRGGPMMMKDKQELAGVLSRTKPGEDAMALLKADRLSELVSTLDKLDRSEEARDREMHARTEMLFAASRGDWGRAENYAVNLLAQSGGESLMSRKLLAASALANRDLLEAKIRLDDLPEGDAESDQLRWVASLMALRGPLREFEVDEMLELTPGGRRLEGLVARFPLLMPWPSTQPRIDDAVDRLGLIGDLARLRLAGRSEDALERLTEIKSLLRDLLGPRWFVAEALIMLDLGRDQEALDIHADLDRHEHNDPYVAGLCEVLRSLGHDESHLNDRRAEGLLEVAVAAETGKMSRLEWSKVVDTMPTNAAAALKLGRRGEDEALAANAWITMGPAMSRNIWPRVRGAYTVANAMFICMVLAGALATYLYGAIGIPVVIGSIGLWQRAGIRRRAVRHRDMPLCRDYAGRLRSRKAMIKYKDLPPGIHLMLTGIVVPIGEIPIDLGYPLWMDPLVGKRDRWLPRLNLGKGSDRKRKKRLEQRLGGEAAGYEGRVQASRSSMLSQIDKKQQQKEERYTGVRNMTSNVVQARGSGVAIVRPPSRGGPPDRATAARRGPPPSGRQGRPTIGGGGMPAAGGPSRPSARYSSLQRPGKPPRARDVRGMRL